MPASADHCGGAVVEEAVVDGLVLRHEADPREPRPELSGHFHPKLRVRVRGRQVSRRCFVATATKLILPAFGALTGGLERRHPEIVRAVGRRRRGAGRRSTTGCCASRSRRSPLRPPVAGTPRGTPRPWACPSHDIRMVRVPVEEMLVIVLGREEAAGLDLGHDRLGEHMRRAELRDIRRRHGALRGGLREDRRAIAVPLSGLWRLSCVGSCATEK